MRLAMGRKRAELSGEVKEKDEVLPEPDRGPTFVRANSFPSFVRTIRPKWKNSASTSSKMLQL